MAKLSIEDKKALEAYRLRLKQIKEGAAANPFETPEEKEARINHLKKDVRAFVKYYLSEYATCESADFQIELAMRVARNKVCFELVRWGRGLAKSVWCDLIIPLWLWYRGEDMYLVIVGNNETGAKKLVSDVQAQLEGNPRIIHDLGEQKLQGSWEYGDFATKDGRFVGKGLGMGQSPRGLRKTAQRPNYIVADDLEDKDTVKNPKRQDEVITWIEQDLLGTMDGDTRRFLNANNDFAPRTIQNQLEKRHPKWHVHTVKAYDKVTYKPAWHQKYSDTYYKVLEGDIGILAAYAEYLHEPHVEGKVFTDNLFQYAPRPRLNIFKVIVGHWDVAYSGNNDYNAVGIWGLYGRNFWKLKAFCRQCKMEDVLRWMHHIDLTLPKSVSIHWRVEKQFWNDPLKQAIDEINKEYGRTLKISLADRSTQKKYDRLISMHPYYQFGRIYYSEKERYNNDFVTSTNQLKGIEPGYKTHDDAPDADQQAVEYLSEFVTSESGGDQTNMEAWGARRNNRI